MSAENRFNITPEQIAKIGVSIRAETPDYIFGDSEYRNAIFENLVIKFGLPWNNDIGCPDFKDPRVINLSKKIDEVLKSENETEFINGITGKCETKDCGWETKCLKHHTGTGQMTKHNRFILFNDGDQVGIASVSTQACTGYIKPL